tara:strand:+ start:2686 stop:3531 length:846 start_codon:yes stop_codon:yes gene_type:complete
MKQIKIKSYAKLNLALNIIRKAKSLHIIESVIAFASLHDEIFIKKIKSKSHDISFSGKFSKNIKKNNTVSKLLTILEKKKLLNGKKFKIKINKKIPNRAGLGGGSMNAANILSYFVKKKIIKISKKEVLEISQKIGSDVIFGYNLKHSILSNNNEIKYFSNCEKFHILIVKPKFGCSTREIYSKVRKFDRPKLSQPSKKMFNFNNLKKMSNSLEQIVFAKYIKLKTIKLFLENLSNPAFVRMTGSGSALVVYFQSKQRCDYVKKQFNKRYKNYWCIASKTI